MLITNTISLSMILAQLPNIIANYPMYCVPTSDKCAVFVVSVA